MQTVFGARLGRHALNAGAPPAIVTAERAISYAELLRRVQQCATWLAGEGCRGSQLVGITIADDFTHLVTSLSLLALGVPQICLPTTDPASRRATFASKLAVGRLVAADPQHAIPGVPTSWLTEDCYAAEGSGLPPALDADPRVEAVWHLSSGTTGQPKIYALSQHNLLFRSDHIIPSERTDREYRSLALVPMEDPMGRARYHYCLAAGVTSVLRDAAATQPLTELCARLGVTYVEMSVLRLQGLVADSTDAGRFAPGTVISTAGAMVSPRLRREFRERFGVPVFIHYGAREFGRISQTDLRGGDADDDTVGRPVPWIDFEIVDAEGRPLPSGEIGEVRVRGESSAIGYDRDPVATSRHFRDGWFYPRDLASLTEDGRLRLHGRSDDMLNLNGIKIFPAEIERVLEEHPAVKAAAAFAKTSAAHGDIPLAAIELHEAATIDVEELLQTARERLGARAPRRIIVLDALPRNAAGKVVKQSLPDLVAAG
jgi:long-chain acyl-CoA synthetase